MPGVERLHLEEALEDSPQVGSTHFFSQSPVDVVTSALLTCV